MPASFHGDGLAAPMFRWFCIPVAKDPAPNWTVESVNAPGEVWDPKKTRVQAVIAGYHTPAATRTVSLVVNGKTIATRNVEVPADGRASVEFDSLDVPYGFSRCEVRIDSADSLPADDVSLFAVERSDPRKVLFVHEANDTRSPLYFRSALASAAESAFTLETVNVGPDGESPAVRATLLWCCPTCSPCPPRLRTSLNTYVKRAAAS